MTEIMTLKQLCTELKIEPRDARGKLRLVAKDAKKHPELAKTYKPRHPWQWKKGSAGEREAHLMIVG